MTEKFVVRRTKRRAGLVKSFVSVNDITAALHPLHPPQRSYQRWLDKRSYEKEMKFWAVLGHLGLQRKKAPTAINMQLLEYLKKIVYCKVT